jgi:hypothetical protein
VITPQIQGQIAQAVLANPTGLFVIGSVAQANLQFNPALPQQQMVGQMIHSLITTVSFLARAADNVLSLMNGFPFDNSETVYTASSIPLIGAQQLAGALAFINATAPRTSGDPSALNYANRNFAFRHRRAAT